MGGDKTHAMLVNAGVVADNERGGVDEADVSAGSELSVQVDRQGHVEAGHEVDKARVAHQLREFRAQVGLNGLGGGRSFGVGPWPPIRSPTAVQTGARAPPPSSTGRVYSCCYLQVGGDGSW